MSNLEKCPFYRDSVYSPTGRGLGRCDLEGSQEVMCKGDIQFCDKHDVLTRQLLEQKKKEISSSEKQGDQEKKPFNYRVLVVDDEEPMRKTITAILSKQEHQCATASNGVEALNKVNQTKLMLWSLTSWCLKWMALSLRKKFQVYTLIYPYWYDWLQQRTFGWICHYGGCSRFYREAFSLLMNLSFGSIKWCIIMKRRKH